MTTRDEIWERDISAKLKEVHRLCAANNIPFIGIVELDNTDTGAHYVRCAAAIKSANVHTLLAKSAVEIAVACQDQEVVEGLAILCLLNEKSKGEKDG